MPPTFCVKMEGRVTNILLELYRKGNFFNLKNKTGAIIFNDFQLYCKTMSDREVVGIQTENKLGNTDKHTYKAT